MNVCTCLSWLDDAKDGKYDVLHAKMNFFVDFFFYCKECTFVVFSCKKCYYGNFLKKIDGHIYVLLWDHVFLFLVTSALDFKPRVNSLLARFHAYMISLLWYYGHNTLLKNHLNVFGRVFIVTELKD